MTKYEIIEEKVLKTITVISTSVCCTILFLLAIGIRPIIAYCDGPSMEPTYKDGQITIGYNKASMEINVGDVVYIDSNCLKQDNQVKANRKYMKRVVAGPGDTVMVIGSFVFVNGNSVKLQGEQGISLYKNNNVEYVLKDGQYFVLGDNRDNSLDSRYYGPVEKDWIIGKQLVSKEINK